MGLGDFFNIFSEIKFSWNKWTTPIVFIFVSLIFLGYYIISARVKLVKKEIWDYGDRIRCLVFAFLFGCGLIIIVTMLQTFIIFADVNNDITQTNQGQGFFIFYPLFFCLIFITFYPLFEFMYMASNDNQISVTPIQKPFEKIIQKFQKPYSYIIAFSIYFMTIILPPIIMVNILNIELFIGWVSWMLLYPMIIVLYYASLGYTVGHAQFFVHISHFERSIFLHYDKSNRAIKEFWRNPFFYIVFFILNFIYFYEIYKTFSTLSHFSMNYNISAGSRGFDWFIPLTLIFAISAFFSRYWKRKVQISSQSIFFSGFLIAAVGINVLINIFITPIGVEIFKPIFETWDFTSVLYLERGESAAGFPVFKHSELNLIGAIEELGLMIIITYFFFIQKNRKLYNDSLMGVVTTAANKFNPIPPFNMCRYNNQDQRDLANKVLLEMYDRIPRKRGYNLTNVLYKDPLFDALCDPSNIYAQKTGEEIFSLLMEKHPKETISLVNEGISSSNNDKILQILKVISINGQNIIPLLDISSIYILLDHPNRMIRDYSLTILKTYHNIQSKDDNIPPTKDQIKKLISLLDDEDFSIEANTLEFLSYYSELVPKSIFSERLNDKNPHIRSIAASVSSEISTPNLSKISIPKLIEMLNDTNPEIKKSAMDAIAEMGNFDRNKVPIIIFRDSLLDRNKNIRESAIKGITAYLHEKPNGLKAEYILEKLQIQKDEEIRLSLMKILALVWKQSPAKLVSLLISILKEKNSSSSNIAQQILVDMGSLNPKKIVSGLIIEQETESFIHRGKISNTIAKIADTNWKKIYPIIREKIKDPQEYIRINAANVFCAVSEKYSQKILPKYIIEDWRKEKSIAVKKELSKVISNIAKDNPDNLKSSFPLIFEEFSDNESSIRLIISKMFISVAEKFPSKFSLKNVKILMKDPDPNIRESSMKILSHIGVNYPVDSMEYLIQGLNDSEWPVKNAAIEGIANLSLEIHDYKIITKIKHLLVDKDKWTRLKVLDIIIQIAEKGQNTINIEELIELSSQQIEDENFQSNLAKLIGIIGDKDFDRLFPLILKYMESSSQKVRKGMISGMVVISSKIQAEILVPKLLYYLSDETPILLQQSIALALKRIVKYESKELKDRVIAILTTRATTSQDEIMTSVLSELMY